MGKISTYTTKTTPILADKLLGSNTEDSNATNNFTINGIKSAVEAGSISEYVEVVNVGDDKGLIFTEQVSVGSPGDSKESVFGEGDSYGVGKEDTTPDGTPKVGSAWHFDYANLSGLTITGATDITTTLASDSGSSTGLFGGIAAGKAILVGSDYTFGGAKAKITTGGTVEPDNITAEYLADNSPTWTAAPYMATDSNFPYTQKGNVLAATSSTSEQWRFGFNPLTGLPVDWDKVTLNINGTDYTKYWAVFRVTSAITLDPQIEQIKLHTNRFEINADGNTEYFGRGRYSKSIQVLKTPNAAKNPANENIKVASGITMLKTDNEFSYTADDGLILQAPLPLGIDTSIPVQLTVSWYPKASVTGDLILGLDVVKIQAGMVFDGTNTIDISTHQTVSLTSGAYSAEQLMSNTFLIDVSDMIPGKGIIASLHRDGSSEPLDTLGTNIVIVNYTMTGYFWRP